MPHRVDTRYAGRHRHVPGRHRAPSPVLELLPSGDRGRAALLTATLSVSLATGVAAGGAAAAGENKPTPASVDTPLAEHDRYDFAPARQEPVYPAGSIAGTSVARKPKPVVKVEKVVTAAWVNPNPAAVVTSCFGPRWGRQHEGVDLAGPDGGPILAAGMINSLSPIFDLLVLRVLQVTISRTWL